MILFTAYKTSFLWWFVMATVKRNSTYYWRSDNTTVIADWAGGMGSYGLHVLLIRDTKGKYGMLNTGWSHLGNAHASTVCEWPV